MKSALSDWKIVDSILYYKDHAYVSPTAHHDLLRWLHDHPMAGHPGQFKTEELIKRDFWWPGLGAYVRKYVDSCAPCQQMKSDMHPVTPPLVPIPSTATVPFTFLSVDLITNLPLLGVLTLLWLWSTMALQRG